MTRALILSADVGESHAAMARELARALRERGAQVELRNDFGVLGPVLRRLLPGGFRVHLQRVGWTYDLAYRLFMGSRSARRAGELSLAVLGGRSLRRVIERSGADVVISTYPVMNPVLGALRRRRRIDTPACAVVGPLAGLGFWCQPDLDLHLAVYEQALPEARRRAGRAPVEVVRPLVGVEFTVPPDRARARKAHDLPDGAPVILISGGGWGVGDLPAAVDAARAAAPQAAIVVVCGRNAEIAERLRRERADVRVLGFTRAMSELMAAADVLVTTTAGSSCLEARMRGCAVICFGFFIGHVRDQTAALERHGLATRAHSSAELERAIDAALARPAPAPWAPDLPAAADVVLDVLSSR